MNFSSLSHSHREKLRKEAGIASLAHSVPRSLEEWRGQVERLRQTLRERFHLTDDRPRSELETHGEIRREGYRIRKVSFLSAPDIRVTGNLYIPDGAGPFPAVLNLHGHWRQGKVAPAVQARGHLLARHGIVVLSVDAAGAGERGETERGWEYHGAARAGELFLAGDSLLAFQVRDNRRALDVLETLPFVNPKKIGATGASGGGNQAVWLSALDERVKVVVPVASMGSFDAYVTRSNCMCETLPGGLAISEQWHLLGAIAPRPLLVLNSRHDQPAFSVDAMTFTCERAREIYALFGAEAHFEWHALEMEHGYKPPALEAMLGWMTHWLGGAPATAPVPLPKWEPVSEDDLLCFAKGQRPQSCSFAANRRKIANSFSALPDAGGRDALARLIGWNGLGEPAWANQRILPTGEWAASLLSCRGIPLPVLASAEPANECEEIRLLLSPEGRKSPFIVEQWQLAEAAGILAATMDLPGTGQLAWEERKISDCRFHDAARACLWLGYTLAGEWAECIALICSALRRKAPQGVIQIHAERETAFATLMALALEPMPHVVLREYDTPESLWNGNPDSLVWSIPDFLRWGDLDTLRALATSGP